MYHDKAVFVTLTYDEESLIACSNELSVPILQGYMKRVRERLQAGVRIKYYAAGEYGDKTGRAHYHAIVFGLGFEDHEIQKYYDAARRKWISVAKKGPLADAWKNGNVILGTVTYDSIRYVADYVQKKLYGKAAEEDERPQPFSIMSQGIGKEFCDEFSKQLRENMYCSVRGVKMSLPRYYVNRLGISEDLWLRSQIESVVEDVKYDERYGRTSLPAIRRRNQHDKVLEAKQNLFSKGNE